MAKRKARMVVGLLAAAVSWLLVSLWHGPIVVSLSPTHGIDTGDLPAVGLIAIAIAVVRSRNGAGAACAPWRRAGRTLSAAAATLGALLVLAGIVQALAGPSLVPAGGGTFEGMTEHVDSRLHLPVGRWSHLAVTYDRATLRFYLDGVLASSRAVSGRLRATHNPLWMGGNRPYGEYFVGELDEVRVYNRALSPREVRRLMSTPLSPRRAAVPRGLVAAYPLDSRAGRIAADVSGRGNNGRINGATWTPDGHFAGALRFEGDGDRVRIPPSRSLDLTRTMTLSAWVRPSESQRGWRTVLHRQTDAYFLDAGSGSVKVDTFGELDDAEGALGALAIAWLCVALAAGSPSRRTAAGAWGIVLACAVLAVAALAAPHGSALADGSDGGARSVALGVLFLAVGLFMVGDTGGTVTRSHQHQPLPDPE